jgi:hypothetical protein
MLLIAGAAVAVARGAPDPAGGETKTVVGAAAAPAAGVSVEAGTAAVALAAGVAVTICGAGVLVGKALAAEVAAAVPFARGVPDGAPVGTVPVGVPPVRGMFGGETLSEHPARSRISTTGKQVFTRAFIVDNNPP